MNFKEASSLAYFNIWENANPYEDRCDEERCVKGKKCTECNQGEENDTEE